MTTRSRLEAAVLVATPFLFLVAIILDRFHATAVTHGELVRPLGIGLAACAVVVVVLWLALRNLQWTSLSASFVVTLLLGQGLVAGILLALGIWWILVAWLRRRRGSSSISVSRPDLPSRLASIYAAAVCLLAVGALAAGATRSSLTDLPDLPDPASQGGPDIFLIVLDGYPRSDTLSQDFGIDNSGFEADLEELDLRVSPSARSNYNKTWLTMASMLGVTYLEGHLDVDEPLGTNGEQVRRAHALVDDGPVLAYLRERGYRIVTVPSTTATGTVTREVDAVATGGINPLESTLLAASLVGRLMPGTMVDILADDSRSQIEKQFDLLAELGPPTANPRLVLVHIPSPHPPFVLGQDAAYLKGCFPMCSIWSTTPEGTRTTPAEFAERLSVQVRQLNELVIAAVDELVRANPEAVVIVTADHGLRHDLQDFDEHFAVLFGARTPAQPDMFSDDVLLVNVFRRLLSGYFGEELGDLPDAAWISDWLDPLLLQRHR